MMVRSEKKAIQTSTCIGRETSATSTKEKRAKEGGS